MNRYPFSVGLEEIRRNWGWFLVLGIALIVLGVICLGETWLTTVFSVMALGWLLILGGIFEIVASFRDKQRHTFLLNLFGGLLFAVGGFLCLSHPLTSAAGLTLLLATLFLTSGVFRMAAAIRLRYQRWGWGVLDGAIAILAGIFIWASWPASTLWVLGTLLGVILLFRGWSMTMFSLGVRHMPSLPEGRLSEDEIIRPAA